jgi:ubiquinone biosynthesis protein UbiJ
MPDRIAEIRARLDAATPGPWTMGVDSDAEAWLWDAMTDPYRGGVHAIGIGAPPRGNRRAQYIADVHEDEASADLIAHAPADIAWLLDEVDALRERVAILRADLEDLEQAGG